MKVHKAVIPAAGLGLRFLPITKSIPKEMLPIVDTPIVELVVQEAVSAGIDDILIISSRRKTSLESYFDRDLEIESHLLARDRQSATARLRSSSYMADIHFIHQKEPLGLGHAILQARRHIGHEPFAVLLPDEFYRAKTPALGQLIATHEQCGGTLLSVRRCPPHLIARYGVILGKALGNGLFQVLKAVEKPRPDEAPSDLAILGRYVLDPAIFRVLADGSPDNMDEFQLTDAIDEMAGSQRVFASEISAEWCDAGDPLGYAKAIISAALDREDIGPAIRTYMEELLTRR